jgi:hypothetical protein
VIIIKPVTPLNAFIFKAVRLRALQDAPHVFGSTYAKESQFADSEWLARVQRMNGESGAGFLAIDGETTCGIAGAFLDQNDATRAHLISMWTASTHRQQGIGRLLVKEVRITRYPMKQPLGLELLVEMARHHYESDQVQKARCRPWRGVHAPVAGRKDA